MTVEIEEAAVPELCNQESTSIINVSAIFEITGVKNRAAYPAAYPAATWRAQRLPKTSTG